MSKKNIIIAVGIIIILVIIFAFVRMNPKQDAMENANTNATSTSETGGTNTTGGTSGTQTGGTPAKVSGFTFTDFTLRMGQATMVNGVRITPLAVEQDSRCAINVQCIQAGSVRVSMKFEFNNFSETQSVVSGNEVTVYGVTGTIIEISPDKVLGQEIGEGEYSFVLRVKTRA
jgi:preprotein translocase subunit YajC